MVADDTALSGEELAFLQDLFRESAPDLARTGERSLRVDASGTDAELLAQLLESRSMRLTAERDGLLIRFELSLRPSRGGQPLELVFSRPTITECRAPAADPVRERAARVRPPVDDVTVEDSSGRPLPARVRDISATGMALTERGDSPVPGARISLHLRLDGGGETDVGGRVVRVHQDAGSDECTIGIAFEHTDAQTRSVLERFVFRKHPVLRH